jgi:hypothetical protein
MICSSCAISVEAHHLLLQAGRMCPGLAMLTLYHKVAIVKLYATGTFHNVGIFKLSVV